MVYRGEIMFSSKYILIQITTWPNATLFGMIHTPSCMAHTPTTFLHWGSVKMAFKKGFEDFKLLNRNRNLLWLNQMHVFPGGKLDTCWNRSTWRRTIFSNRSKRRFCSSSQNNGDEILAKISEQVSHLTSYK